MAPPSFFPALLKACLLSAVVLQNFVTPSLAASKDEWRTRSIYQILTDRFALEKGSKYKNKECEALLGRTCGGTWRGIKENLDYVQDMGFDAIWISPVVGQIPKRTALGDAYTGYWQQDLYSLNDEFGSEEDLLDLIEDVHSRGMLVMMDVVVNHMAWSGNAQKVDYSQLHPFDDQRFFHDFCIISDYTPDGDAVECWLGDAKKVALPDLRTEDAEVRQMLGEWITGMVANYSIDGMRIDTVLHVEPEFFPGFMEAAGIFGIGEVLTESTQRSCIWEKTIGSVFNVAMYYAITRAFAAPGTILDGIVSAINSTNENCDDSTAMGSFSEVSLLRSATPVYLHTNFTRTTILTDSLPKPRTWPWPKTW
jgi:alpha-amylase